MIHRLRCLASGLLILVGTGLGSVSAATAAPPERVRLHVDDTFLSRTSEDCGFDILLHLEGTISSTTFVDRHGEVVRALVTYPNLFYTFTNAATGQSVTSRSPDPEHYRWSADGSLTITVTGLVLHLVVPGSGTVAAQAGRFVIRIDADGEVSESDPTGRDDDYHAALCGVLAA